MSASTTLAPAQSNGPPHYQIDHDAVLRALDINPRDPKSQALLLTCQRYGLDPVLKHALLIQGRLYVTRDGLLHVAHRSGQLDGIEVLDQGESQTHHVAKVAVYRKDMSRPFTYIGRYPKNGSNRGYGPEMAVKCGEVMALRRAFDVAICAREEAWDQDVAEVGAGPVQEPRQEARDAVNESFPPGGRRSRRGEAGAPPAVEPWAKWSARTIRQANLDWQNHQKIERGDVGPREILILPQLVNFLVSSAIEKKSIFPEEVSKDGRADGPRDPGKALEAAKSMYDDFPDWVAWMTEAHLDELWARECAKLGIDNPRVRPDTGGQATAEHETQEPREPGQDG